MKTFVFCILSLAHVLAINAQIPVFKHTYTATGKIFLPYAEIEEPFTAYYDKQANKSRIDYYGDLMQTLQLVDLNQLYKIVYTVNNQSDPIRACFNIKSSPIATVTIQTVLPDLSKFELKKSDVCKNFAKKIESSGNCEAWEYRTNYGQKNNKYFFVLKRDSNNEPIPIYYLMMGYDSLLGSHYDKFEIIYDSYTSENIEAEIFDIPFKYNCTDLISLEPNNANSALFNPIKEFIDDEYDHIDHHFNKFLKKHKKSYTVEMDHRYRKNIFRHNYRYIMSHNRKSLHYKLAVNHLADRSLIELKKIRGVRKSALDSQYNGGLYFDKSKYNLKNIPNQWDWRLLGAVTPVKDQAICGSCYSFGTTGTVEGVYFVKTGHLLKLSEQQLVDCSWSEHNNGCDGGEDFQSYHYLMKAGGLSTEEDYGSYLGVDGKCHDKTVKKPVKVTGFYNITVGDVESLKAAVYYHGPVTVSIDSSLKAFSFYSNGIFYEPKCSSNDLDHQVLVVGFGEINNEKYWLVKNSWSTYWGNDGYVLMSQKNNNCGVLTDATFPIVE